MMTIAHLASAYSVRGFIDYERDGDGLLLHNGTGIALAVMDELPELRYCVDLTGLTRPVPARLRYFLDGAAQLTDSIVGALIFFADKPDAAGDLLSHADAAGCRPVVLSNVDLPFCELVRHFDELTHAVRTRKAKRHGQARSSAEADESAYSSRRPARQDQPQRAAPARRGAELPELAR